MLAADNTEYLKSNSKLFNLYFRKYKLNVKLTLIKISCFLLTSPQQKSQQVVNDNSQPQYIFHHYL